MVFSGLLFLLLFLPFFLIGYQLIASKYKNSFALLASLLFYGWGAPDFIVIAIGSIVIDFYLVKYTDSQKGKKRFIALWVSILFNLSFLLYYKYYNFFLENVNSFLTDEGKFQIASILLPIGISFFTFQKISYTVDVYRKTAKPLEKLFDYGLYIMLFPQLIAGPIVRFNEIAEQLKSRDLYNINDKLIGFFRFSIGLAKKVLIANVLGEKADLIFGLETVDIDSSIAWFGIVCYTFQIYFDFSGYSDMAIGLGRMMGFKFPENFNSPYIAQSITEFWKRWHITLGSWMRDYLYIPLGGNRVKSKGRLYLNLWVVFLISGLWHGASWNFLLWGGFHGIFLIFDRLFLNRITSFIGTFGRIILTFFIVMMGWVLFRTETLTSALDYYNVLFVFDFGSLHLFTSTKVLYILVIAATLSSLLVYKNLEKRYLKFAESEKFKLVITKTFIGLLLLVISIASLTSSGFNPFIYFRF